MQHQYGNMCKRCTAFWWAVASVLSLSPLYGDDKATAERYVLDYLSRSSFAYRWKLMPTM